jgi:hypothetical protein
MSKSLTEAAKAVLEGKILEEGIPAIGPLSGGVSNPNPVDQSTVSTGNAKTLHPGTKQVDARFANPNAPDEASFSGVDDLGGATPTSVASDNLGAKAAGKTAKDTSKSSHSSSAAEKVKQLKAQPAAMAEEEEFEGDVVEEDIEISEELEDFINEAIEAGLDEEEILAAIEENFEFDEEVLDEETLEESPIESYQVDMSEHVNALLEGENLSEEFHAKATTIFEAAVKAKLEEEVALLEQAYAETLEERVSEIMEQLSTDVDNYLNYVVEQWIEENEVAVESALRSELTEDFIGGLRSLFAEHYIDIPEEEVHVVEELSQTVEKLEEKLNEEIERNVHLTSALNESRKYELVNAVCEGLTSTQAEKLKGLVENVSYNDDETFINKISTLRENYFPTAVKSDEVLDRVESADPKMISESTLEGPMAKYVQALGRNLPK